MGRINIENLLDKTGSKVLSKEQKKINRNIASRKYYLNNKEKIKKKQSKYRLTIDIKKKKIYARNYYLNNKKKINENRKKNYIRSDKFFISQEQKKINTKNYNKNYWLNNKNRIYKNKKTNKKTVKNTIKNIDKNIDEKIDKTVLVEKDSHLLQYFIKNIWNSSN